MAIVHRLKRKVRVLAAQKRRLVRELRTAKALRHEQRQPDAHGAEEAA